TPTSPARTTADKLTSSDNRTIASRAGSPLSSNCSAETSSGMERTSCQRHVAFGGNMVNFGNKCIFVHGCAYAGSAHDRRGGGLSAPFRAQALRVGGGRCRALHQGHRPLAISQSSARPLAGGGGRHAHPHPHARAAPP